MKKPKPCPFCGGTVKIVVMDDEFNIHDSDYEKDPWSGLQYGLTHPEEENPDCPIANIDDMLGTYGYDTREEAIEAWDKRVENDRKTVLLKACLALLEKQNNSRVVLNLLCETVFYDEADCDGYCLIEDIKSCLEESE